MYKAWEDNSNKLIKKFCLKRCITTAMDGTEDDQTWKDDSNSDPFPGIDEDKDVDLLYADSCEWQH